MYKWNTFKILLIAKTPNKILKISFVLNLAKRHADEIQKSEKLLRTGTKQPPFESRVVKTGKQYINRNGLKAR